MQLLGIAAAAAVGPAPPCNATAPAFLEGLTVDSVSEAPPLLVAYSSLSAPSMVAAQAQRVALECLLGGRVVLVPFVGHRAARAALDGGRAHYAAMPAPEAGFGPGNHTISLGRSGLDVRVAFAATPDTLRLAGPGASVASLSANATVVDRAAPNATSWAHLLGPPVRWDGAPADDEGPNSLFVAAPPRASAAFQAGCEGGQSLLARAAPRANISCRPAHSQETFRRALAALESREGVALVDKPSRAVQGAFRACPVPRSAAQDLTLRLPIPPLLGEGLDFRELAASESVASAVVPLLQDLWSETPYHWPPIVLDLLAHTAVDNDAVESVVAVRTGGPRASTQQAQRHLSVPRPPWCRPAACPRSQRLRD